jgi:membrane protein
VVVWVVLGIGFRLYMDRLGGKGYDKTYGTLGGVAILLLLFYIDALVLLIGAEINSEIDFEVLKVRRGTRDFRAAEELDTAPTAV